MITAARHQRRRIAVLISNYTRIGGAERYCVELTERLAKHHEVHVFYQRIGTTQDPDIQFHQIPLWVEKPRYINNLLFSYLSRKATENQFDIVHSHAMVTHANVQTLHVPCVLSRYSESKGIKKLLCYLNTLLSPRLLAYLWLEKYQIRTIKHRQIIAVSEFLARNITHSYPDVAKHISIAYPGIQIAHTDEMQLIQRQQQRALRQFGEKDFVLLFVANDYKRKGLPVLLEALKTIQNPRLQLIVAGNDQPEKFTDAVAHAGLTDQIHFIGACTDMEALYPAADALVHPTLADTYAMVVLEAMAHALPVIVSNARYCGFAEHLTEHEALLIENPKDASEIADHIQTLVNNSSLRQSLARQAKQKARSISWDDTVEQTLLAYDKALAAY